MIARAVFELERFLEIDESSLLVPNIALRRCELGPGHGEIRIEFDSLLIVRKRSLLIVFGKRSMTEAELPQRIERGCRGCFQRSSQLLHRRSRVAQFLLKRGRRLFQRLKYLFFASRFRLSARERIFTLCVD